MTETQTSIAARFNGPPGSANGGYTAGTLGMLVGEPAEVTLRKPPAMEKEMTIRHGERGLSLYDGKTLIANARVGVLDIEAPPAPTDEQVKAAEASFWESRKDYGFTTCFVCGPDREHNDGMRIFPARIGEQELVAAHWTPTDNLADEDGVVDPRVVWAALDCPTFFGGALRGSARQSVLGRMTADLKEPVHAGHTYTVIGWPIAQRGRITIGASAIYDADGVLCAISQGTWMAIS